MNKAHKNHEKYIIEGFCATFERQFQTSCSLIKQRESPDALLRVERQLVSMELAQYREKGPRLEAQESDRALKKYLSKKWRSAVSRRNWSIVLTYHVRNGHHRVPSIRNEDGAMVFEDLRRLVRQIEIPQIRPFMTYLLVQRSELQRYQRHDPARRYLAAEHWPNLSKFCSSVRIHHHPGHPWPNIGSSLDAFATALDTEEIARVVRSKLEKAETYRNELSPKRLLWLLIYSEGWNPTGCVFDKASLKTAHEIIRKLAAENPGRFDAIWWGDEVEQSNGRILRMDQLTLPDFQEQSVK